MTLKVDIIAADELGDPEMSVWRDLVAADEAYASPFLRPEFTRIAGQVAPNARVAVFHRGGRVVGFFPHQRRGPSAQPLAAPMNDYHGLIFATGEPMPELAEMPGLLRAGSLKVNGWVPAGSSGQHRQVLAAYLPDGWEPYEAERRDKHAKFFKDKDRARRCLKRDFGGEVRTEVNVHDPALLEMLIGWKQSQYRKTRHHDVFACGWTVDVLRALVAEGNRDFGACLAVLWAADRPAAIELGLYAGSHYHFWFPAYAVEAARCSPGILLSQDTMRLKAPDGFKVFDFGFAGEVYKKYFCNLENWVTQGEVFNAGWRRMADQAVDRMSIGPARKLTGSVRRRWAVVEACETTVTGRVRGVTEATAAGLQRFKPNLPFTGGLT